MRIARLAHPWDMLSFYKSSHISYMEASSTRHHTYDQFYQEHYNEECVLVYHVLCKHSLKGTKVQVTISTQALT